jgi:hypothetical protein
VAQSGAALGCDVDTDCGNALRRWCARGGMEMGGGGGGGGGGGWLPSFAKAVTVLGCSARAPYVGVGTGTRA